MADDFIYDVTSTDLDHLGDGTVANPPGTWQKKPVRIRAVQMLVPFQVRTLEGTMAGAAGDWLIVGVQQERYPCRDDIFQATYQPAEPDPAVDPAPEGSPAPSLFASEQASQETAGADA